MKIFINLFFLAMLSVATTNVFASFDESNALGVSQPEANNLTSSASIKPAIMQLATPTLLATGSTSEYIFTDVEKYLLGRTSIQCQKESTPSVIVSVSHIDTNDETAKCALSSFHVSAYAQKVPDKNQYDIILDKFDVNSSWGSTFCQKKSVKVSWEVICTPTQAN